MKISDVLTPSFYILEVEGAAIDSIFPGGFDIERIVIGSGKFESDLHATAALKSSFEKITEHLEVLESVADFNPDFFPSYQTDKISDKKQTAIDALSEYEDKMSEGLEENKLAVAMPALFDPLGDYVESRWECSGKNFKMLGRVAIDPDVYIQQRISEKLIKVSGSDCVQSSSLLH